MVVNRERLGYPIRPLLLCKVKEDLKAFKRYDGVARVGAIEAKTEAVLSAHIQFRLTLATSESV